ncbi:MAG: endonuclease III [Clostridia bacterium]|nr:endonuclease III [Clostridia bacterium]
MTKKEKAAKAVSILEERYPDAECALRWNGEPWKLLIMGMLSAQCTDARVNIVCEDLFKKYTSPADVANADVDEFGEDIRSCGLWRSKSRNIIAACGMLVDEYGGVLPDEMDELLRLPGVGRKIANLLLGDVYGKPAIVADTHCIRISGRIGLCPKTKDPLAVEKALVRIVEPEKSSDFCHRLVWFGREVCTARSPKCDDCPMVEICADISLSKKKTAS